MRFVLVSKYFVNVFSVCMQHLMCDFGGKSNINVRKKKYTVS